ncbi:MAG: hypothetical protein K2X93_17460 [Candidatus Obscuribacterales bacterium]|nr:hypothetical protein [Candidatus Obscuribacterales bacterium]
MIAKVIGLKLRRSVVPVLVLDSRAEYTVQQSPNEKYGCRSVALWAHALFADVTMIVFKPTYTADKNMAIQTTAQRIDTKLIRVAGPSADASLDEMHSTFFAKHFAYTSPQLDKPEGSWILRNSKSEVLGHFSLWYNATPILDGDKSGFIGHFFASDGDCARELLEFATALLKQKGCKRAIGPIDGNTFRRYRFVVESSNTPPFFMEPENPTAYPDYFTDQGFDRLATYSSSVTAARPQFLDPTRCSAHTVDGVTIRTLDLSSIDQELEVLYRISCSAFENNFLYTPIQKPLFFNLYRRLTSIVDPNLVLVAESQKTPVGFAMTIPDLSSGKGNTAILKTVARIPDDSLKGLGLMLIAESHARATTMGFTQMIHALYKDDNTSGSYSTVIGAKVIRRYAVFQKLI